MRDRVGAETMQRRCRDDVETSHVETIFGSGSGVTPVSQLIESERARERDREKSTSSAKHERGKQEQSKHEHTKHVPQHAGDGGTATSCVNTMLHSDRDIVRDIVRGTR